MKSNIKNIFLAAAIGGFITVTATSCKKDDPAPTPTPNVVGVAQADTNFSILVSAVVKTGLQDALSNTANITVFAPVNNAFRALGYTSPASITALTNAADIAKLKSILQYHVIAEKIPSSAITSANIEKATLSAGAKLYATGNASGPFTGVYINGVKVITADVPASNGVIHAIGKVLIPPAGTLLQTAVSLGADTSPAGFSLLVAAVLRADEATTTAPTQAAGVVTGALSGAGPLTVFAPTNKAFSDAGFPTVAAINAASPVTLRNIILYHVVGARVFSSNLTASNVETVQGTNVTIALPTAGPTVKGTTNTSAANVILADVIATNGVIHAVNQVLLP
jgi:uncharacterized surface protein with fasciclin (FAS1) repeats